MEGWSLLFGELADAALASPMVLLVGLGVAVFLLAVLGWVIKWARRLALLVLLFLILGGTLVEGPLYETVVRWLLDRVESVTEVEVEFSSASGSLLFGRTELEGVTIVGRTADAADLNVSLERLALDVDVFTLLSGTPRIRSIALEGVTGSYNPPAVAVRSVERPFDVGELTLDRVTLEVGPAGATHTWSLQALAVSEAHHDTLFADFLTKSEGFGQVDGHPFVAERVASADDASSATLWRVATAPRRLFAEALPVTGQLAGNLDVLLEARSDAGAVSLRWQLELEAQAVTGLGQTSLEQAFRSDSGSAVEGASRFLGPDGSPTLAYSETLDPEALMAFRAGAFGETIERAAVGLESATQGWLRLTPIDIRPIVETGTEDSTPTQPPIAPRLLPAMQPRFDAP